MATGISGQKVWIPRPPDKGSFPIDHYGECKDIMIGYLECLNKKQRDHSDCRDVAKDYLQCRMDRQLMAKEDWKALGFSDDK